MDALQSVHQEGQEMPVSQWGNWHYDAKNLVLRYAPKNYEIHLKECSTSAQMLDQIFEAANQPWMDFDKNMGDLIRALRDLKAG